MFPSTIKLLRLSQISGRRVLSSQQILRTYTFDASPSLSTPSSIFVSPSSSSSSTTRLLSSSAASSSIEDQSSQSSLSSIHETLLTKKASVRRTFSPNSNAKAMLVCGGKDLAANASFDPEYKRAKGYIQNHAVGPAVLSPILISGLVGALIESTLPQSFFVSGNTNQLRPLIVGVEVEANIQVISVKNCSDSRDSGDGNNVNGDIYSERYHGYELLLDTEVKRVRDGAVISNGNQTVWLPDYGHL